MMEQGFSGEMSAQEDLSNRQAEQETWMGRIRGAIAGDEKAEPFHFKPQVSYFAFSLLTRVTCEIE